MTKPRAVVFTGAGFSKGLGLPLTAELWEHALEKTRAAEDAGLLWDDVLKCAPLVESIKRGDKDVERLLNEWETYVEANESKRPMPNIIESGRAYRDHYVTNLAMLLDEGGKKGAASAIASALASWIYRSHQRFDLSFVTTNYDTCLERASAWVGLKFSYTGSADDVIAIRKLHGSVNWIQFSNQPKRLMDGWKPDQIGKVEKDEIYDFQLEPVAWIAGQIPPVLIPPIMNKRYEGIFTNQFNDARELIAKAERILFVGYSFPPADKELGKFIEGCVAQSSCKRYSFVSPDEDAKARAEAILKGKEVTWRIVRWEIEHLDEFIS